MLMRTILAPSVATDRARERGDLGAADQDSHFRGNDKAR